jgi:hypothetical protein
MNGFGYAWEKLYLAVLALAAGTGSLSERLRNAWMPSLRSLWHPDHIPDPDLRARFDRLREHFAPAEGRMVIETLSVEEQRAVAEEICSIYDAVRARYARERK